MKIINNSDEKATKKDFILFGIMFGILILSFLTAPLFNHAQIGVSYATQCFR